MLLRLDNELLLLILYGMRQVTDRRFWVERLEASDDNGAG
jgi:hypothetical protein